MKRIKAIVALLAVASTIGLGNAFAQGNAVRATMPFDFTVGNKVLPAGTYTINRFHNDLIEIRGVDKDVALLSTSYGDETQSKNGPVLVFDKCGGDYFLREVLGGSAGGMNVNLPLSKAEERARQQESLAKNITQVSIAATAGY
jgi:hypothetical protein